MITPTTVWDRGPTDAELNSFYGNEPTSFDKQIAIERQAQALDADDLAEICHIFPNIILSAVRTNDYSGLMEIFKNELKTSVARRASAEVYGDVAVIKTKDVTL